MQRYLLLFYGFLVSASILFSCKSSSVNLFKPASPHEQYRRKLEAAGLDQSAMGMAWINSSNRTLQKPVSISIPYRESGYFAADKASAAAYRFTATKGQKISITLSRKPETSKLYLDLWYAPEQGPSKLINSADTLNSLLQQEIDDTGSYLIRIQPELLQNVSYALEITAGPSLAFPTRGKSSSIQSYWGDGRDHNTRKHEGVDIFGSFRSPVLASAEGRITRVNENNLGGKVVWLRPNGKDYTLYYAHLDEQIAIEGQEVKIGDTVGLMGNTGNARTTPTHLHFGIYTFGGAINPLPFIDPVSVRAVPIQADLANLNSTLRTTGTSSLYASPDRKASIVSSFAPGTVLQVQAAVSDYYKVKLPDGKDGFMRARELTGISKPLRKLKANVSKALLDQPDLNGLVKTRLEAGQTVNVLGNFDQYQLVSLNNDVVGWISKE